MLTYADNYASFYDYFDRYSQDRDMVILTVELHNSDPAVKYAFVRYIHNLFHSEFYHYMCAHTTAGAVAKHAMERFFKQYGITEDDYKLETAKKRWQRYKILQPRTLLLAA